jgi:outer membrane receptor protein involved in Fe transport
MVFAEAAKGYRYGGVNQPVPLSFCAAALAAQGLSGPAPVTFGPDQLWSYSLGEKSTVAGGRATLDATGFFIDWRGMQTNDNLSCGYYFTQNAGHVTSKGVEFQGTGRLTDRLNVSLSGSYTDATAAAPIFNLSAPAGESVPYFPKYILNGSVQYRLPLPGDSSLLFEADDQYRGETYSDFDPSIRRRIPASNVVNTAVTYDVGRWEVGLYARNLTNEHVVTTAVANQNGPLQPGDAYYYAPPRIVGLRVRVDF